jgi:UDP-GlcNAc:undecaprenyl-phosphate GlcNAc-1-phosphate transferase
MYSYYLLCFVASIGLSLILTRYVRDFAVAKAWVTPPLSVRHIHQYAVPRLGGVAIFLSVILTTGLALFIAKGTAVVETMGLQSLTGLFGASAIVLLLGIYDDLRGAGAYLKFGVQAGAAVMLYLTGYGVHHLDFLSNSGVLRTAIGLPLTIFWVLLVTNAFNLIDGLDGLAAGSAFFSTMVMFLISLFRHNSIVSIMTIVLAGAILGFLRFNSNPASIFLGDSGSLFVGFMLSALALAGSQKATTIVAVAIPVVALGLPILDVALAVARRVIGAKPLFDGDFDHIHHKLLKRGLSQRAAVLVLYGATAGFGLLSVGLLHGELTLALALVAIAVGVVVGVHQLRYVEFSELNALLRAVFRNRIVANNVNLRRAAELLGTCSDLETFCRILQDTLQPLGFSGFRLENFNDNRLPQSMFVPLSYDSRGGIQFCWASGISADPDWELRLQLTTSSGQHLGYLCLIQLHENWRPSFDLSVMTDGVRTSISDALKRAMPHDLAAQQASHEGSSQKEEPFEKPPLRRAAYPK